MWVKIHLGLCGYLYTQAGNALARVHRVHKPLELSRMHLHPQIQIPNAFPVNYLSGGERRIAIGNIAKQGIHKQCGISLETPKLPSQNLNEKIEVSNLYLHSFPAI